MALKKKITYKGKTLEYWRILLPLQYDPSPNAIFDVYDENGNIIEQSAGTVFKIAPYESRQKRLEDEKSYEQDRCFMFILPGELNINSNGNALYAKIKQHPFFAEAEDVLEQK